MSIARHEIKIDLEGIIKSAAKILDNRGKFAMVHRPDRMIEILNIMQKYEIEPKELDLYILNMVEKVIFY